MAGTTITDYDSLQTRIADYMARGDLTEQIPDFIRLAEDRMNDLLRVAQMEQRDRATLEAGDPFRPLPSDFLAVRTLGIVGRRPMSYMDPTGIEERYAGAGSGVPEAYTIIGRDLKFAPTPGGGYEVELVYYGRIPNLGVPNDQGEPVTSNWVLAERPGLYLYGALLEAAPFMGADERLPTWERMFSAGVEALKAADQRARYNGAPLVMRTGTRNV